MPDGMACVLFTDLVGSTELLSSLGEAAFDDLRRAHFAALRVAINKTGGTEVKTLGDGVLATFPSAAAGVEAAVAIQQATDRQARTGPAHLAVRVGLALGDVSFEDTDVFGTPVVEAARLVDAARPGQILASAVVRAVAGGRTAAHFTDSGHLALKGLPQPLATCEVAWEPLPAGVLALPSFLTHPGRVFVGRGGELERLRRL
jgi:class 3 adenylate cyclase